MDFFRKEDFDFFETVRQKDYRRDNPSDKAIGKKLIEEGVYAKTFFWAELLRAKGFKIELSRHWQNSGHYRSYTWAKVYFPDVDNTKVFFTVGVGSRFTESDNKLYALEYKLDCQRKNSDALDPSFVYEFDRYMRLNCPEASQKKIDISELKSMNWDSLVEIATDFIRHYEEHYFNLVELTSTNESNLLKKIVRLCWNNHLWEKPSGDEGKSKASDLAFEKDKGYGYEEWLFNQDMIIDGYRYGFIQSFNKGNHYGQRYEIFAYAIENINYHNSYYWIPAIISLSVQKFRFAINFNSLKL